jgi:hypothetical protein
MFWFVRVYTSDDEWINIVANANAEADAEFLARTYAIDEGHQVYDARAEVFNSFEHGDPQDYEILV